MKPIRPTVRSILVFAAVVLFAGNLAAADALPKMDLKPAYPNLKFDRPVALIEAPDGTHRQFLVEQAGRIWILPADRSGSDPKLFLDISDRRPYVENEEGLLSLAFHPGFKTNGKFYIFYSHPSAPKHTILAEWQVSKTDPDKADPSTERILLNVAKRWWNHNGGTLLFGRDGYLYLGIGDGGAGYDPKDGGQNLEVLYGKIIRIDVNSRTAGLPYGIPKDNPFVDVSKQADLKADPLDYNAHVVRQEIWAYGVRNPWRMSFDRETGELWAGDVGQDLWEEVDIIKKGGNYGWSAREAFHPLHQHRGPDHQIRGSAPIDPIIEYPHSERLLPESKYPNHGIGVSITGGYVYRGKKFPDLRGVYVYADFQMGTIWGLRYENGKLTADGVLVPGNPARNIPSFSEDSSGELYVLSFDGTIYEFTEAGK
ncbi:MAG TPA: PQQ-dependent sugar dehydrogenase [Candidatus Angelobacter sp.]|nr:PQQ-dependent sugar dehydrogenase [Candidatus Angelobacter sp.]